MSEAIAKSEREGSVIESVIAQGDLSKLTADQRVAYYAEVCRSVGLNPLTQPFAYLTLNGKLTLYAKKDATDQLRSINGVSVTITNREQVGDVYVVTARVTTASGRFDESVGAVSIANTKGDALANALMKAETKAKRRATLSICGLGFLDETEIETIPNAQPQRTASATISSGDDPLAGFREELYQEWIKAGQDAGGFDAKFDEVYGKCQTEAEARKLHSERQAAAKKGGK